MAVFYIESSALFKRFRTETGTEAMNAIFDGKTTGDTFVTSHLVLLEMQSAAARGLKSGVLNGQAHGILLRSLAEDLSKMIILPVSSALVTEAAKEAGRHKLRSLDAIHFASAIRASQAVRDPLIFVSSDKELLQAAENVGFITINPEKPEAQSQIRGLRRP